MFEKLTIEDCLSLDRKELVKMSIERIKKIDKFVKSFITVVEDPKFVEGPYSGIPIAIKDNITTEGIRTTCASKILENYIPCYDATAVKKLKQYGFAIVGKTNLDEFAMGSSTERSAFFITRNPWNLKCVPGGSSGGSAAAVASGEVVASLGSDTGGSVRQPASFCGVVGFKPSYGLVSRYGLVAFASSLDQIGPITKTVRDAALLMDIISGKDPIDSTTVSKKVDFLSHLEEGIQGMRFAVPEEVYNYEGLDNEVAQRFEEAIKLAEKLGAKVAKVKIPTMKYVVATYYIIAPAEASSNLARYDGVKYGLRIEERGLKDTYMSTRNQGFGEEVRRRIMLGTFTLSAAYYEAYFNKAQKVRKLIANDFETVFKDFDAVLTPTSPVPAFEIGSVKDPLTYYLMDIFTIPANLIGGPAISIPFGFAKSLPVGLQIMGKRFDDGKVLQIARAFEKNSPYNENGRFPMPVVKCDEV
ncbi:Asp-tRNA(Asn)/Glu-tRNA(Gln) amidotransferase subunit GatA [Pseudothermotoga thermarum]|uniref:Glutamyl-tRNA(Gln) amidotransferase subunit A n=1 Tax=Pseudothermotoga thermarum DSM 5069 TaxID=688269 RepID=F7YYJ2_9THEM|nr:Asp-tRNA(Asn)/Glu-tRNA(Gln) amidotransferase subunit GatA [Pseudothermotoga thermarum]AEH51022.1 aspartyl/glutamyl-tRNA(Asn/Gln) amidotransferase subunit A [Pseudothermotoga thermarum DSM 5069]